MNKVNCLIVTLASLLLVVPGCRQRAEESGTAWTVIEESDMGPEQTAQRDKALAARDAMFASLKGRLMEVMGSDGPGAAISVCASEAPRIAEQISQAHGLEIGRTSFRLRNTENMPRAWAVQLVDDRVSEPTYLTQDGKLAALLPIRIQTPCLVCHGAEDAMPSPVREALSQHYPDDRATGFKDGDLRGWFSVEVPAIDG